MYQTTFARTHALSLVPACASSQTCEPYEPDEQHHSACQLDHNCPRCFFELGFKGALRRGSAGSHPPSEALAWCSQFQFDHPTAGRKTWVAVKPYSWGGPWSMGCWVCNFAVSGVKYTSTMAKLSMAVKPTWSDLAKHAGSSSHALALEKLSAIKDSHKPHGVLSGISEKVPRLDKFHLAGTIVSRHDSQQDFHAFSDSSAVGSALAQGSDQSRRVCSQIIHAMAQPYREQDQLVIQHAACLHWIVTLK
jgi:hypothetical protein